MATSSSITPGMILSVDDHLYKVESSVKVTVAKGNPFIKAKLKDLTSGKAVEKNFKLNQTIKEVPLEERRLEFLYLDQDAYLFLDIDRLDQVRVPLDVIGEMVNFLKEGVEVKASICGDMVFTVELPQFLELMVKSVDGEQPEVPTANVTKVAMLETGAEIVVPPFVEPGDIIKVDTRSREYIQRV